jgi:membrane associated rhomboid family serine protease
MQRNFFDELKYNFKTGNISIRLLYINIAIFIAIKIYVLICFLYKIPESIALHYYSKYLLPTADIQQTLFKPWSLFIYMFTHFSVMHILFNMIMLYFIGKLFLTLQSEKRFLNIYILGGLFGWLLYAISYNIFPVFEGNIDLPILGASASVMALFVSIALYAPNMEVFLFGIIKMRLIWIMFLYLLLDLIQIPGGINAGGHISHFGGAALGALMAPGFKNYGSFFNRYDIRDLFKILPSRKKMNVVYSNKRSFSDEEYNRAKADKQKRIDAILDKISKSGYEALSKEEKDFLFKASKDV